MKRLTESEYHATFSIPMLRVSDGADPPFDFWGYFDQIPADDFENHDCSDGSITYIWRDSTSCFEHILVNSKTENVFMVLILDIRAANVLGHRLLSLNREYGIDGRSDSAKAQTAIVCGQLGKTEFSKLPHWIQRKIQELKMLNPEQWIQRRIAALDNRSVAELAITPEGEQMVRECFSRVLGRF